MYIADWAAVVESQACDSGLGCLQPRTLSRPETLTLFCRSPAATIRTSQLLPSNLPDRSIRQQAEQSGGSTAIATARCSAAAVPITPCQLIDRARVQAPEVANFEYSSLTGHTSDVSASRTSQRFHVRV